MPVETLTVKAGETAPCRGFTLEVKVFVPKSGFRIHVIVDKTCAANNEALWALKFELEKKIGNEFVQIVFVDYKPKPTDKAPQAGIQKMVHDKLSKEQVKIVKDELFPVAAQLEGASGATPAQAKALEAAGRKIAVAHVVV
jgi:hypothetical protein